MLKFLKIILDIIELFKDFSMMCPYNVSAAIGCGKPFNCLSQVIKIILKR